MKRVLCITYYWPPSGKASLHLPLAIIKHLPNFGWQPSVLTVEEDKFSFKDESLFKYIDPQMDVIKSKAFEPFDLYRKFLGKEKDVQLIASETISKENKSLSHRISVWIRMNLFIPDARAGWYYPGVKEASEYIKKNKIDAVISIGPPHTAQLIGKKLCKKFNIPFIPIFIDPWTDIAYYKEQKRSALTKFIDNALEKSVISRASHIVFVTDTMRTDFVNKYPFSRDKSSVLYWGYNEEDFKNLPQFDWNEDGKVLVHAGNIFDYQNPLNFWKLIKQKNNAGEKIKIKFIGTASPAIKKSIEEIGLVSCTEYLGFLPYKEMLSRLLGADYLMVCASEPRHVPGKLFECLRIGKPVIAFGDGNEEVKKIVADTGAGMLFHYDDNGSKFFENLNSFKTNLDAVKQFDRLALANNIAKILSSFIN
ncbi:MAG: glycosyltransferase [Ignavibacteriaceae bacterium]|nr:glycosyltransferase [Ignavibacteriaceae bacterium]